ncbi:MAG: PepSY-associated TM helix domain-containing protein [Rhizonema sp. PD38]|nr:PepSY-associated TM helix domain-containing protein [Rhizonema sp. PD38]
MNTIGLAFGPLGVLIGLGTNAAALSYFKYRRTVILGEVMLEYTRNDFSWGAEGAESIILLHFSTFGGLSTRILYVFVGLAPLILFVTGFVMWWYRYRAKSCE